MADKKPHKKKQPTTKGDKGKQPTFAYLKSAPPPLIALLSKRKKFPGNSSIISHRGKGEERRSLLLVE